MSSHGPRNEMPTERATSRYDVVISGASYAGLALARALSQATDGALAIALVDRAEAPARRPDARAFALSAASCHLLEVLGIWPEIAAEAQPVTEIEITDSSLEDAVRPVFLTYENRLASGEPASHIIPGAPLLAALHAIAIDSPGVRLVAPAEARALTAGPLGANVELSEDRKLSARLVVAAEGRRSALRDAAGIKTVGWSYGQTGIVTTVAHTVPHDGRAVQHFLPSGPFAILPLTGNRACITWSERTEEALRILALDDAGFLSEIDRRFGGRLGTVSLAGPRQSWPLEMHLARRYTGSRLALLGDTAHGVHPIAGQGLNLGLRDVAALAETVTDAARLGLDIGSDTVLEKYERWRRFDSALSSAVFDGLNRLFSNDSSLARAARDFGLQLVNESAGLKTRLVEEAAGLSGEVPRLLRGLAI